MSDKIKVAFVCVHNSCRSQIAEALGKKYLSNICECYSAGTETKSPVADVIVSMGCNVICPYVPDKINLNWGLEDPTGQSDEKFLMIIEKIYSV